MPSKCLLKCLSKNFCLVRVNLALFTMIIHLRSFVVLKCIEKNTKTPKPKLTHMHDMARHTSPHVSHFISQLSNLKGILFDLNFEYV